MEKLARIRGLSSVEQVEPKIGGVNYTIQDRPVRSCLMVDLESKKSGITISEIPENPIQLRVRQEALSGTKQAAWTTQSVPAAQPTRFSLLEFNRGGTFPP